MPAVPSCSLARVRRRTPLARAFVLALALAWSTADDLAPAWAAETGPALSPGDLTIVLTALEDGGGADPCRAHLRIAHGGAVSVSTFSLRLLLFAPDGGVLRQVDVLAMPLIPGKATPAVFPALDGPCSYIGSIRVTGFPLCAGRAGQRLDCGAAATTANRTETPFGD